MPKWFDRFLLCNFALIFILGVRAVYLGLKFMNQVWVKEPEKSKELGFPPDGLFGSVDTMKGWWSKIKFDDPELERLRTRSRIGAICFLISWIPPVLLLVIFTIKLIVDID